MSGKAPRPCAACGERPVAFTEPRVDFCYQCLPGGPFTPPPCRRCGSRRDYYSAGLCTRCHKYGPGGTPLKPCPECYCWGIPATWTLPCQGCQAWHRKQLAVSACARCGRNASVDKDMTCRLCRRQPSPGGHQEERGPVGWHQLFLNISFHSWHSAPRATPTGPGGPRVIAAAPRRRHYQLAFAGLAPPRNPPRPKTCPSCGQRPVKDARSKTCHTCIPGGAVVPPPCRKCGSVEDYYSAGLCIRCHKYAPQITSSCPDCYAWGTFREGSWLCRGCYGWRRNHPQACDCKGCGRRVHLKDGICRLCWKQAEMVHRGGDPLDPVASARHGHQLFIADLFHRPGSARPKPPPAPPPKVRAVSWCQTVLFDIPRDFAAGLRTGFAEPPDPELAGQLDALTLDHAARHGWRKSLTSRTRQAIRILLACQDTPGAAVKASQVVLLGQAGAPVRAACEVLAEAGMLDDDRVPSIDTWFARAICQLPEPMADELRTWFEIMRDGSTTPPRLRPRSPATIRLKLRWALPALHAWAASGHASLREITRQEVIVALPPSGTPRATVGAGLRSVFTILKAKKVVFTNPTAGIRTGSPETREPLPTAVSQLHNALTSDDPLRAAAAALLAFCGLEPRQLPRLLLTDIRDGRLHLPGRTVPLADPVLHRLADWLDERQRRWPLTANPHLFINQQNATRTSTAQADWITKRLGISAQAIREDRILHEAHATRGDVRRLIDLFGLSVEGAQRYTATVDHPAIGELAARENHAR